MSDEPLLFHCVCGQQAKVPDPDEHRWAQMVGYAGHSAIRWHPTAEAAELDEAPMQMLLQPPEAGREYWLRLNMPFAQQIGETFWCLYESPSVTWNGLYNMPEEVVWTRLVACKLLGWERHSKKCVVGNVAVREVVTLEQLAARSPFSVTETQVVSDFEFGQITVARSDGYLILDESVEGGSGSWVVMTDLPEPEVLLYTSWGSHYDYVWAGRGRMVPELAARLAAVIARSV